MAHYAKRRGAHCYWCNSAESLETHHRDFDHTNNAPENLCTLCHRCHVEATQIGYLEPDEFEAMRQRVLERDPAAFRKRGQASGQLSLFDS